MIERPLTKKPAHDAAYYAAHREEARAYQVAYQESHREEIRARRAAYRAANPEKLAARNAADYAANVVRRLAYQAVYRASHPDARRVHKHRRRALGLGNGGCFTVAEWREKCALLGDVCIYCGTGGKMTADHKIPLFRGGSNDIANIVPACGSCNSRKHTKTAAEFMEQRQSRAG